MDSDKEKAISDLAAEVRDEPPTADTDSDSQPGDAPNDSDLESSNSARDEDLQSGDTASGEDRASPTPTATAPAPEKAAKGGRLLGSIALLLAIAACVGIGYLWYLFSNQQMQQGHQQEIAAANLLGELKGVAESTRALEKQQDKLSSNQGELTKLIQEKLEDTVASLQAQQEELTSSVTKLYDSVDRSIDSWALEEVEQLLRMANHSVSLAGDVGIATIGLDLADRRLAELGNPDLVEVRRLIADEITQLNSIQQVDIPGLALRLASLATAVQTLPLMSEPDRPMNDAGGESDAASAENMWMEAGQALLSDLSSLVRIQNVTESAKPLLAPEQRYFLISNLRLMLSGAQIAALRTDTETFRANLNQAVQWINDYFDPEAQPVQAMSNELKTMAEQDLTPARPNITGSIVELQAIKSRMKTQ